LLRLAPWGAEANPETQADARDTGGSVARILLILAAGAVAGALLPLPPLAKTLLELLLGLVFRAQIWKLFSPLRVAVAAACQRALAKFNSNRSGLIGLSFLSLFSVLTSL